MSGIRKDKKAQERERLARRLNHEMRSLQEIAPKVSSGTSTDPVVMYLRSVAETFGLGYVPEDMGGLSPKLRFKAMVDDTLDIVRDLFGPSWKRFISHVGLPPDAARLLAGKKYASQSSLIELRLIHMTLLTHIGGIRQDLDDYERKLWVLLQQGHDPHFTGEDARLSYMSHINRGRQHMREALGNILKKVPKPYYLPLRALAMIEHPGLDSRAAKELTKHDMYKRGELNKAWTSQSYYDGLSDDNIIGLHAPLKKLKNGKFGKRPAGRGTTESQWYKDWWWKEYEETGKRPNKDRSKWDQDTWDSFMMARERARFLVTKDKRTERGAGKATSELVKDLSDRDLREYMRIRRMERDAERRRFFNWLDKHNQDDPETAAEKMAKHLDEVGHGDKLDLMTQERNGWLNSKITSLTKDEQPTIAEIEREHTLERMDSLDGDVLDEELAAWEVLQGDASWAEGEPERAPVRDTNRIPVRGPKKKKTQRKKRVDDSEANQ